MKSLWRRIKRNPVINAFVLAMVTQLLHDYLANQIDWTNIAGYLATVAIGIWARENVVPLKEHEEKTSKLLETNSRLISKWDEAGKEIPRD